MNDITPEKSFETLKQNVVGTISSHFPYKGRTQSVVLNKIWVDDKHDSGDLRAQADAKDNERTWGVPVKADISLIDNATGKVIDNHQMTMARLPKLTSRYGFIVGGSEYQVDHLFRLKSGVYARVQDNGDLESEFNLAKGQNFSIKLNRESKTFEIKHGTAHIPLYPVLKAMGVSDDDLEKTWGKEIFALNKPKNEAKILKSLNKFHEKTADDGEAKPADLGGLQKYVNTYFDQTVLRPDTTKQTLGKSFDKVTGETLHLAAAKLLGISRETQQTDDRDSLAFKEVVSAEDFIPEALDRSARSIRARLRQTTDKKHKVIEIVQPRIFEGPIMDFFTKGGSVSERSDQTNPVQMMSSHRKTTLMSEQFGGIKKQHSLTGDMKVINPSHFGFLDPMHTPESERTGITLHLGLGVRKNGKNLETPVYDLAAGKLTYSDATEFHNQTAVLPDQVRWEHGKPVPIASMVKCKLPGGAIELRPFKDATHVMPSAKGLFSPASNLIPFLQNNQGNRVSMADKQMEQAISLVHREAPLVQSKADHTDPEHTFEKTFGGFSSIRSPVSGKVVAISPDSITVHDGKKKHEIQIYHHFPLNDPKGQMHSEHLVGVGSQVKAGQTIADTNFTKNGVLALGSNLRIGYVPYKGYNYEDGIVISETAAKKLTSDHLYKHKLEIDPELDKVGKKAFHSYSATKSQQLDKAQWDALGEDGIIKPGSVVKPGAILVASVRKNTATKQGSAMDKAGRRLFSAYKSNALTWDEDHVGIVTKVVKDPNGKGIKVYVKTEEQMQVGDKISGRHGNKGIVTQILPDHEMPFTVDHAGEKKPLEVLLNPSGVPTRINVGQILETAAAKVAEKTGKPFVVDNFAGPHHDYRTQVLSELKKHGLSDEELVYDPLNPKKALGSVLVGPQYLFKLKHQVEKKLSVRSGGTDINGKPLPVDVDRLPQKGGEKGGQGFGALEQYSLLAHNARHNLREMATYKSDYQGQAFWDQVQQGLEPPPPKVPFAYEKFVGMLRGMGVNVVKNGTSMQVMPMTSKDVLELAGPRAEIKQGHLGLHSKNLKEEKDGLFDPHITGGINGSKWSFIKLHEPMPNPIFVGANNRSGPVPQLLGLKIADIDRIMEGKQTLNGKSGGAAIEAALKKVDVQAELKKAKAELPHLTGSNLDRMNKKLRVLMFLNESGMKPHEAYIMHHMPVLPPMFRPATPTPGGDINLAPINNLYKNLSILNQQLQKADSGTFSDEHRHPLRAQLWDSLKAVQSVGNYRPVYEETSSKRKLTGLLTTIATGGEEGQPKTGYFQSKLIKRRQNLSIRSTIVPEPKLHIDEVGLPKNAAMELYKPFVVADMTKHGFDPLSAQQEMRKGTKVAFDALERVVKDRPMFLKRDPALHKFSVMAFRPVLVEGKAIQIHPLVCGGFNADFDGDAMSGTVPVSREAVEEARKLFPSKNLFSPTTGGVMYTPNQESMLGLHLLSQWGKKTGKKFSNPMEANKAADKGEISHTDVISIGGKETTLGRYRIADRLPQSFGIRSRILHDPTFEVTKKTLGRDISTRLAKEHEKDFSNSIDELKNLGNAHAYDSGFSFGLKDLAPLKGRDAIIQVAHNEVAHLNKTVKDKEELHEKTVAAYQKATEHLEKEMVSQLSGGHNRLATMVYSGARGKVEQLRQMVAAPMLMQDAQNRTIATPVTKSYAEGLDVGDYWLAQHGARKGTLQRAMGTSEPGAISKDIINTTMSTLIVSPDCKTTQGIHMDINSKDIHDRFTAKPYKLKDGTVVKEGTLLTPEVLSRLKNAKESKLMVRSPLKCQHGDGICAKCFGLNEGGKVHAVGTNIGVLAGQSLGEPAVQMAMDAFHSGGIAAGRGAGSVGRFERLRQLLSMSKQIKNEATLSRLSGKVTDIKKDTVGGLAVFVNGERHYVPAPAADHDLQVGHEVRKGQTLSRPESPINPHHLLKLTDMPAVQNYLTNELHGGLYEKEDVRRRNVEVVVRALTNLTKIVDPGHGPFLHGDIAPHSVVEEHNRTLGKGKKPIVHEPILRNIEQVPLTGTTNWMARLNYRDLQKTIQEAASQGWKSNIHGNHPIPGIAYGKEFGKPPAGSKPHSY